MKIIHVHGDDYVALEFEDYVKKHFNGVVWDAVKAYQNGGGNLEEFDYVDVIEFESVVSPQLVNFFKGNVLDYDDSKYNNIYYEGEVL